MKKTTFTLITFIMVVLFLCSVFAQTSPIDKGSMMAAGGFSFSKLGRDLYEDANDNS